MPRISLVFQKSVTWTRVCEQPACLLYDRPRIPFKKIAVAWKQSFRHHPVRARKEVLLWACSMLEDCHVPNTNIHQIQHPGLLKTHYARENCCKLECMKCGGQFSTMLKRLKRIYGPLVSTAGSCSWALLVHSQNFQESAQIIDYLLLRKLRETWRDWAFCQFSFWSPRNAALTTFPIGPAQQAESWVVLLQTYRRAYYTRLQSQVCQSARHRVPALD